MNTCVQPRTHWMLSNSTNNISAVSYVLIAQSTYPKPYSRCIRIEYLGDLSRVAINISLEVCSAKSSSAWGLEFTQTQKTRWRSSEIQLVKWNFVEQLMIIFFINCNHHSEIPNFVSYWSYQGKHTYIIPLSLLNQYATIVLLALPVNRLTTNGLFDL